MGSFAINSDPHAGSQDGGSRRPAAVMRPNGLCAKKEIPKDRNPGSTWEGFSVQNGQCVPGFAGEGAENPFPFEDVESCTKALNSGRCG